MDTRQISPVVKEVVNREYTFTVQYYLATEDDRLLYEPTIGDVAEWAGEHSVESVIYGTVMMKPIVRGYKLNSYLSNDAAPYILHITAKINKFDIYFNMNSLTDVYTVTCDTSRVYLPLEYWSARKALVNDENNEIKNIYNVKCMKGDLIYNNATSGSVGDSDDFKNSPLDKTGHPDITRAQNKVDLCKATISFYSTRAESVFYGFEGRSGEIPSPVKSKLPTTDEGKWLADSQRITTEFRNNRRYTKVVRKIALAPYSSTWSSTKHPTWTWANS